MIFGNLKVDWDIPKKEKQNIEFYLITDKPFSYIDDICSRYSIKQSESLFNQLLDNYNHMHHYLGNSSYSSLNFALSKLYFNASSQYKKLYGENDAY